MKLALGTGDGDLARFEGVVAAFSDIWSGHLLDCGSRSGRLRHALGGLPVQYTSLDLFPPADIVATIDERLPLADCTYDVCVAMDILEHTNDMHFSFGELCRVARHHVVISLPNCFELRSRLALLRGRHISSKYGLGTEPRLDRHRWFFSLNDAREFARSFPERCGFVLREERALVGPRLARLAPLVRRWPNVWAPTYVAMFERTQR